MGFGFLGNVNSAASFCGNCTFGSPGMDSGYQNSLGFATAPIKLSLNQSCPNSLTLSSASPIINVDLIDQFGSLVYGKFLEDNPTTVQLNSDSTLDHTSYSETINSDTGAASFGDILLCGENNSTVTLTFQTMSSGLLRISPDDCSILLYGCSAGYKVEKGNPCDYCLKDKIAPERMPVIIILLIIIFSLCGVLCIMIGMLSFVRYR